MMSSLSLDAEVLRSHKASGNRGSHDRRVRLGLCAASWSLQMRLFHGLRAHRHLALYVGVHSLAASSIGGCPHLRVVIGLKGTEREVP
eukprot:6184967-Pleurochrysis_carterae.AAC.2